MIINCGLGELWVQCDVVNGWPQTEILRIAFQFANPAFMVTVVLTSHCGNPSLILACAAV